MAWLGSLLRLALVRVVMLPLWALVESCLPASWAAGPFVLLLLLIHVSSDLLPFGLILSVAVLAKTLCSALRTCRWVFSPLGLTRPLTFLQKKDDHRPSVLQGSFIWPQTPAAVVTRPVYV